MPGLVYLLSAATALTSAILLWRGWRIDRTRLLFWSALCFFGLCIDNLLLYLDLIVFPEVHMYHVPSLIGLVSVSSLLYGLVWEGN